MVVLIIGFGSIAQKHFHVLKKLDPNSIVYALRSSSSAPTIEGVINIYSWEEINFKPDFVLISSPTSNHATDIEKAISLNCPLFIEKPVLDNLDKVHELKAKIDQTSLITYVACVLRFHPCLEYLREKQIVSGRINEVNIYCGSYLPDWRPGKDFRTIYSANASMGGGVHLDMIHELDYAYWLFGMPTDWRSYASSASSLDINSLDFASYLLNYNSFNVNVTLNYYRPKAKRIIEIVLSDDIITVDLLKYTVANKNDEIVTAFPGVTIMDLYEKQLAYFIECIKSHKKCENDFANACNVLTIALKNQHVKK